MTTCNGCGGTLSTRYPEVLDPQTRETFAIAACNSCGLGHTSPQPEDLSPYYGAAYHGGRHGFTAQYCVWRRMRFVENVAGSTRAGSDAGGVTAWQPARNGTANSKTDARMMSVLWDLTTKLSSRGRSVSYEFEKTYPRPRPAASPGAACRCSGARSNRPHTGWPATSRATRTGAIQSS